MKLRHETLWAFLERERNSGVDVRVFPSNKRDADGNARFVLRVVNPDEPETGHFFLASFSKSMPEEETTCRFVGDNPTHESIELFKHWSDVLTDEQKAAQYSACHCFIEEGDVDETGEPYPDSRVGSEYVIIAETDVCLALDEVLQYVGDNGVILTNKNAGRSLMWLYTGTHVSRTPRNVKRQMITNTEPLWSYLQDLRNSGMDVVVYPSRNEDSYEFRVVDSEAPNIALSLLASSSASELRIADRPKDPEGRKKASARLNAMLNNEHAANRFVLCYCIIDEESVKLFPSKFKPEQLGKTYVQILHNDVYDALKELTEHAYLIAKKHSIPFKSLERLISESGIPSRLCPRTRKTNHRTREISNKFKKNFIAFKNYLTSNRIKYLYHFTERSNIESIKENGGLFSWKYCEEHSIVIPKPGGDSLSRRIDVSFGLEDYVRLSFCERHPMAHSLKKKYGYDIVVLKIKIDVAWFKGTMYSDINAADKLHHHGDKLSDLKRVNIAATRQKGIDRDNDLFKQQQAEVLVKTFVPIDYIVNIDGV